MEQQKPKAEHRGYRPIAAKHGVKYKTLHNLVNGGCSLSAFNALKKKLTTAEESVLVNFIARSADLALSLSVKNIGTHANEILKGRNVPDERVGKQMQEEARKLELVERATRNIAKGDRRAEKERLEVIWKQMQQDHALAVQEWDANCQALLLSETWKRDLPKKPKLGLKPKLQKTAAEDEEADEGDGGSGSDDTYPTGIKNDIDDTA